MGSDYHLANPGGGCVKMFFKSTKSVVKLRNTLIGVTLLVAAIGSSALSLGRARGAATLGQPLDIAFEVRLDSPDDSSAPCVSADILHGDTRVDPSKTRISVEPGNQPQDVLVRMRSSVVVDEPIVTVVLRVGCHQNTTRRYDFLADFPTEARATVPPMNASQAAPPAAAASPAAVAGAASAESPSAAPAPLRTTPTPAPRAVAPAAKPAPAPARTSRPAAVAKAPAAPVPKAEPAPAKPRLKLESVEVVPERQAGLKTAQELTVAPPVENAAQRAEAAALWQALNAQPQELIAQAKKLQDVETANKALREQAARNEAKLAELLTRVQKMEDERYANGVTYGLLALLLAVAALAVYLWVKRREAETMAPEWWRNREAGDEPHSEELGVVSTGSASMTAPPSVPVQRVTKVDVDLDSVASKPDSLRQGLSAAGAAAPVAAAVASPSSRAQPGASLAGRVQRSVNPEELFDVQQHAEFFVSLGQYDQAIAVLKKHIGENVESSPLAYLDLLKIYHTLSRIEDYNLLRSDFNRIFNGRVPPFAGFSNEGKTLDNYAEVMADIQELWPSPQVLTLIEEYLYPQSDGQGGEIFDLAAFRELLLLHAMGKSGMVTGENNQDAAERVAQARRSRVAPMAPAASEFGVSSAPEFTHSELSSVSAVLSSEAIELYSPAGEPLSDVPAVPRSDRLGLDVDLSEEIGGLDVPEVDVPLPSVFPDDALPPIEAPPDPEVTIQPAKRKLVDFNLFDPDVEADITPKATKH